MIKLILGRMSVVFSYDKSGALAEGVKDIALSNDTHETTRIAVDNPITELEEDTLGRGKLASSFAEQILGKL